MGHEVLVQIGLSKKHLQNVRPHLAGQHFFSMYKFIRRIHTVQKIVLHQAKSGESDLPVQYLTEIIFEILLELPQLNLHRLTSKRIFFSVLTIALENAFAQPTN